MRMLVRNWANKVNSVRGLGKHLSLDFDAAENSVCLRVQMLNTNMQQNTDSYGTFKVSYLRRFTFIYLAVRTPYML